MNENYLKSIHCAVRHDLQAELKGDSQVIYVGYSNDDKFFDGVMDIAKNITLVDKSIEVLQCLRVHSGKISIVNSDILDYTHHDKFKYDMAVLPFVLHENTLDEQRRIVSKLKNICTRMLIIEPLLITHEPSLALQTLIAGTECKKYATKDFYTQMFKEESISCRVYTFEGTIKLTNEKVFSMLNRGGASRLPDDENIFKILESGCKPPEILQLFWKSNTS